MTYFNLNQRVRVKLTDRGRALLKADHESFWIHRPMPYTPPKEDAEGWSEWQLWSLMQQLGNYIQLGDPNVIETDIKLEPFD